MNQYFTHLNTSESTEKGPMAATNSSRPNATKFHFSKLKTGAMSTMLLDAMRSLA